MKFLKFLLPPFSIILKENIKSTPIRFELILYTLTRLLKQGVSNLDTSLKMMKLLEVDPH